jgi:RNase H-like domain found in reverse transcriptase
MYAGGQHSGFFGPPDHRQRRTAAARPCGGDSPVPAAGDGEAAPGFLSIVNFYCRFVPGAASILLPLTEYLKGGRAGSAAVEWSEEMRAAFRAAKAAVATATTLAHPVARAELAPALDASDVHVGAVLQQRQDAAADWRPLGFFSKKLESAQIKYSTFDHELYACFAAIRHFRFMLEGR